MAAATRQLLPTLVGTGVKLRTLEQRETLGRSLTPEEEVSMENGFRYRRTVAEAQPSDFVFFACNDAKLSDLAHLFSSLGHAVTVISDERALIVRRTG